MRYLIAYSLFLSLFLTGCATTVADPKIDMSPPAYVEELPPKAPASNISHPGSLFGRGDNPLFGDRKAMNPNDIVTVFISESLIQSSKASKSLSKSNTSNLGGGAITNGVPNTPLATVTDEINKYTSIGFETNSGSNFAGSGSNSRNESFSTTISARIIKVMNNGNYFIEGSRELLLNGEKQVIQISGVIRPYDISQNNQIDSKHIADAKILYLSQGDIHKSSVKPWGTKIIESIWPF
ncbi:MAG: flagellar basal body L-ring protein FlgH [Campylobacterales bacterium]|nr:flagellar basal body L-ring protein FlgH [Campylobacterales bacterium]